LKKKFLKKLIYLYQRKRKLWVGVFFSKMEKINRTTSSDKIILSPKRTSSKNLFYKLASYNTNEVHDIEGTQKLNEFKKRNSAERLTIVMSQLNQTATMI
jgi:hypothetical protein